MNGRKKGIFLDRDGVINREVGDYITQFSDFEILPHVLPGLKLFSESGYELIVITNQGGIAKGLYSVEEMKKMHAFLMDTLGKENIHLTDIYYCPHHPNYTQCLCRKPGSILVEKAISKHQIDPALSWFIGDKERDIVCGEKAGVKGMLIEPNEDWTPYAQNTIKNTNKVS